MGLAKEKPLYETPTDYEDDVYLWLYEQIELLRQKRIQEVDLPNLIEELEDMGSEKLHALESAYRLLLAHLLKWKYQPQKRSSSWEITIGRERDNIDARERESRTLAAQAKSIVETVYRRSVREAATETGLPRESFPTECPWTLDQLRDEDFLPD
ncbi:DUF29 domain-containing protein [Kaistia sp. MMO-174]|uniref:DUF29 domain-containing protein n=1 Tax=Kaistia sp. MMO-174 TaxID=3081256 RepID=UPI001AD3B00C|nr:DUF29 domain-containing protein [Hyphomicrobiales bacterium]